MSAALRHAGQRGSLLAALVAAGMALPAQNARVAQRVDAALLVLADKTAAPDAVRELQHLGPAVVAPLRARLRADHVPPLAPEVCVQVVHVLGRLDRHAVSALPELRALLRDERAGVPQQAMWALAMLAPFLPAAACSDVRNDLATLDPRQLQTMMCCVLLHALQLGDEPSVPKLLEALVEWDAPAIAACRWLKAYPDAHRHEHAAFCERLVQRLEAALQREPIRWMGPAPGSPVAAELADAWLALTREPLNAATARALLDHDLVDVRRRAVAWMHDHGAALPLLARADLLGRLWDVDATLVEAAARAFAAWGCDGLVALPALRALQRATPGTPANACGRAADAIVAATAGWPDADRAWLAEVDAALRGVEGRGAPAAGRAALSPRALAASTDLLLLAQWCAPSTVEALLGLCPEPCPPQTLLAVFGAITADGDVASLACAWLARHAAAARAALATVGDVDTTLGLAARAASGRAQPAAVELAAHVALAGADDALLAQAIDAAEGRTLTHALALALSRPALPPQVAALAPRLRELLAAPARMAVEARHGGVRFPLAADLTDQLRSLCAIALCVLDEPFDPPKGFAHALRSATGLELEGLRERVAELRRSGGLIAVLERVEDGCRAAMDVPAGSRWPPLRPGAPR
jgi:hypothetical protein